MACPVQFCLALLGLSHSAVPCADAMPRKPEDNWVNWIYPYAWILTLHNQLYNILDVLAESMTVDDLMVTNKHSIVGMYRARNSLQLLNRIDRILVLRMLRKTSIPSAMKREIDIKEKLLVIIFGKIYILTAFPLILSVASRVFHD